MTFLSTLKKSVIAGAAVAGSIAGVAVAQDVSLQQVLDAARQERSEAAAENRRRIQEFQANVAEQRSRLNTAQAELRQVENAAASIDSQFEANQARIAELQAALEEREGEFGELFGAARSAAADLATQVSGSILSAQYPGRASQLSATAESDTLPSVAELENIYLTHLQEMVGQAETTKFEATTVAESGETGTNTVTRIGPFVAFVGGDYYTMKETEGGRVRLTELPRQPQAAGAVSNARSVSNFTGDGYTAGTIDPTTGQLLQLVIQSPDLKERIDQGGAVGYVILILLAIGVVLGLFRWFRLFMINLAVKGQVRKKTPSRGNPLGRVMMAYESNTDADVETLSLKLDDAVIRELPKLEWGLNILKVMAAIAPLLGLLGTVVGMIVTFQQITLFGTGDPQIMAGGISQALVTTVLGLVAAIPLLLLHAFASGSAKSVAQVLEEQSAGMIAEHAESRA